MAESILEGVFMNIPTPIIADILARLPPKSVIRCSCVCKPWLNLISEPEFVNLHLSKSPTCLVVHKRSLTQLDSVSLVEVEDETDHHGVRPIAGTDRVIPRSPSLINTRMSIIGSIDGLVCIKEFAFQHELIHVWNPIMGEFITVHTPPGEKEPSGWLSVATYGFGISSGKYLVVKILQRINTNNLPIKESSCHVYTIGDGVWKSIGHDTPYPRCSPQPQHGLFFNGNLYWIIYDDGMQITCLDLEKELFQPFPPLPELYQRESATLNIYKGCLSVSVCCNTSDSDIVIWVMKEYGVQKSWSKEVVISKHLINSHWAHEVVSIIKVFKDDEILLTWGCHNKLFLCHPKRKILQEMYHPCIEATEYVSSLVSLKSLGEVNVSRCRTPFTSSMG